MEQTGAQNLPAESTYIAAVQQLQEMGFDRPLPLPPRASCRGGEVEDALALLLAEGDGSTLPPEPHAATTHTQLPASLSSHVNEGDGRAAREGRTQEGRQQQSEDRGHVLDSAARNSMNSMEAFHVSVFQRIKAKAKALEVLEAKSTATTSSVDDTKRLALVIGSNAYATKPLSLAANDATDMHALLLDAGFEVTLLLDATHDQLVLAQSKLVAKVRAAGREKKRPVVVVFFSGHGADINKATHLLPVDFDGKDKVGLPVDDIIHYVYHAANNVTLLMFCDACREDPGNSTFRDGSAPTSSSAIFSKAVSGTTAWADEVPFQGADVPTFKGHGGALLQTPSDSRYFLGYACKPGTMAVEAPKTGERNGYFTKALLQHLRTPDQDVTKAYRQVMQDVETWTHKRQGPTCESNLVEDFAFFGQPDPDGFRTRNEEEQERIRQSIRDDLKLLQEFQNADMNRRLRGEGMEVQQLELVVEMMRGLLHTVAGNC